jgi:glucose/mannose transport system substrate-binding protein
MSLRSRWFILLTLAALLVTASGIQAQGMKKLEIFSWWTAGGEADGLKAMFEIYKKQNPGVEIVNATVAGGAGTNAKAVLKTRMQGGDPPDSFQVHGGAELVDTWVKTGFMESLSPIFQSEGLMSKFPRDLINIVSHQGNVYSVPVNIHRGNVLWYSMKVFSDNKLAAPKTWDEFFKAADTLKAKGIAPLSLGDKNKWEAAHLFEDILVATLGAAGYRGLWSGQTSWTGDGVKKALDTYARILGYVNTDHAAGTWDSATQMLIDGKAAMTIMGDWAAGYFTSKGWKPNAAYGYAPAPGTSGVFVVVTDTFGLPKKAPHRAEALAWLKVAASKEGQEAFNPLKGSICGRLDCDKGKFDAYLQSSMADFGKNALVPSEVHGSAAPEGFATQFNDIVNLFVTNRNVSAAQRALQQACVSNGMCKK